MHNLKIMQSHWKLSIECMHCDIGNFIATDALWKTALSAVGCIAPSNPTEDGQFWVRCTHWKAGRGRARAFLRCYWEWNWMVAQLVGHYQPETPHRDCSTQRHTATLAKLENMLLRQTTKWHTPILSFYFITLFLSLFLTSKIRLILK